MKNLILIFALLCPHLQAAKPCISWLTENAGATAKKIHSHISVILMAAESERVNAESIGTVIMSVVPEYYEENSEYFNFKTSYGRKVFFDELSNEQVAQVLGTIADDILESEMGKRFAREMAARIVRDYRPPLPTRISEPTFSRTRDQVIKDIKAVHKKGEVNSETAKKLFQEYRLGLLCDRDPELMKIEIQVINLRQEMANQTVTRASEEREMLYLKTQRLLIYKVIMRMASDNLIPMDSPFIRSIVRHVYPDHVFDLRQVPLLSIEEIRDTPPI